MKNRTYSRRGFGSVAPRQGSSADRQERSYRTKDDRYDDYREAYSSRENTSLENGNNSPTAYPDEQKNNRGKNQPGIGSSSFSPGRTGTTRNSDSYSQRINSGYGEDPYRDRGLRQSNQGSRYEHSKGGSHNKHHSNDRRQNGRNQRGK